MSKKRYTEEFKAEAVKLVTDQGYSQAEAGRSLGVSHVNINRWVLDYQGKISKGPEKVSRSAESEELARLRKENKRLKLERDILKKAAAFFANEPT